MKNAKPLTRWQTAGWNLAASTLVFALTLQTARFLYPGVFWDASNITRFLWISVGVGLVLGPVLMAYLWVPGKRGLWFDMIVIALLQAGFWGYCHWSLYAGRPAWLVFAADRFVVIRHGEIDSNLIPDPALHDPRPGNPLVVIAVQPEDPGQRLQITIEAMQGKADIDHRPSLWKPPSPEASQTIDAKLQGTLFYWGPDHPVHNQLLLIGPQQDLLVHFDTQQWVIDQWENEPTFNGS